MNEAQRCAICGCQLCSIKNVYGKPTIEGRSHRTRHHLVAERFFGRYSNKNKNPNPIFKDCPWNHSGSVITACYDCHEHLLHNPVFTQEDILQFAQLVKRRNLNESTKTKEVEKIGGRIKLLNEIIKAGLAKLNVDSQTGS